MTTATKISSAREELRNCLSTGRREVIYQLTHRGICSELVNLLLAVQYALRHRHRFSLYSKGSALSVASGWSDFFEPFCRERTNPILKIPSAFYPTSKKRRFLINWMYRRPLLAYDIWHPMRSQDALSQEHPSTPISFQTDFFCALCALTECIYRPNAKTQRTVAQNVGRLKNQGLPTEYISIHVRRGDKVHGLAKECESIPVEVYLTALPEGVRHVRAIHLATDDINVKKQLQEELPESQIFTLAAQPGYQQHEFDCLSEPEKTSAIIDFLTDLTLISGACAFVGAYSSNVPRFAALLRGGKNVYSVDGHWRAV